jgi:hypothetical protein
VHCPLWAPAATNTLLVSDASVWQPRFSATQTRMGCGTSPRSVWDVTRSFAVASLGNEARETREPGSEHKPIRPRRGADIPSGACPGPCYVMLRQSCLEGRWGRPGKTAVTTVSPSVYGPSPACQGESAEERPMIIRDSDSSTLRDTGILRCCERPPLTGATGHPARDLKKVLISPTSPQ